MPPQNLLRESCTWGYLDGEYPRGGLGYLDGDTRRGGCSSAPPPLRVPPIKVPPPLRVPPPGRGYPFSESWCLVFGEEKKTIVSLFFLGTPNSRCLANWEKLKKRRFQVTSYKLQVTSYKLQVTNFFERPNVPKFASRDYLIFLRISKILGPKRAKNGKRDLFFEKNHFLGLLTQTNCKKLFFVDVLSNSPNFFYPLEK